MRFTKNKLEFSDNEIQDLLLIFVRGLDAVKDKKEERFLTAHTLKEYDELITQLVKENEN